MSLEIRICEFVTWEEAEPETVVGVVGVDALLALVTVVQRRVRALVHICSSKESHICEKNMKRFQCMMQVTSTLTAYLTHMQP